jgi:hypothetical protein
MLDLYAKKERSSSQFNPERSALDGWMDGWMDGWFVKTPESELGGAAKAIPTHVITGSSS